MRGGETQALAARLRAGIATLVCSLVLAFAARARAQDARVVLATHDAELVRAVEATLAPWQAHVITVDAEPGATMPASADQGRAIAESHRATVVVWISRTDAGPALWTYDRASDRVVSRRLPSAPPFDDATAAAVALAVKTMLRHSAAAPPGERLEVVEPPSASIVRLELALGARALATSPGDVEPRAGVAASLWPDPRVGLGIAVGARAGTGIGVTGASFSGRLLSVDVFAALRGRWAPMDVLDLGLVVELGASIEVLDGQVLPAARGVTQIEADPTLAALAELGLRPLDALRVALRVGAQGALRTRSYLVRTQSVLETSPARFVAELVIELPLDGQSVRAR